MTCAPLVLYALISSVGLIVQLKDVLTGKDMEIVHSSGHHIKRKHLSLAGFLMNVVVVLVWGYLLHFLCMKGYTSIAWVLVLLKLVFVLLLVVLIFSVMMNFEMHHKLHKERMENYPSAVSSGTSSKEPKSKYVKVGGLPYFEEQNRLGGYNESIGQALLERNMIR